MLREPEPEDLSPWELAAKRAIHEIDQQLTAGAYNIQRIRHILTDHGDH